MQGSHVNPQYQPSIYGQQPILIQQQPSLYAQQQPQGLMMNHYPTLEIPNQQMTYSHQQGIIQPGGFPQQIPLGAYPQYPQQNPINAVPQSKKGWDRLQDRQGIFIKQKLDIAEVITGCEQGNTYYVYPLGKDGNKKGKKIYKAKEKSSCFAKQCLSGACRPFLLKLNLEDDDEALDNEPFLQLDRPCKCTCLCFNRPEMTITYVEDGRNDHIGKIRDLWQCCGVRFEVFDATDNLKYVIHGNCCQWGMWCRAPCDACENVHFDIKSPSGEIISTIKKKSPGCINAMISDADNFVIHFPSGSTKEEKALLMSAALLLDYRYFEEKGGGDNN